MMPLRLGTDEQFRLVREFLDAIEFTDENAAPRIGFARLDHIGRYELMDHEKREAGLKIRDALGVVVKLLVAGWIVDAVEVAAWIPEPVLEALEALDLLERKIEGWVAPVLLYPAFGLYLTSDRYANPDGSEPVTPADFVFLTLQRTGMDFMSNVPGSACESSLDLGTGNGIAALWAARNCARHAWGVDIVERSIHFATFNARLNGIQNVTFLQGDMYAPVEGRRFDRITMHPPYSIAVQNYVYAYGGEDGEYLARRAIEGAPDHLTPGGILYCWTTATDRHTASLEQRVRAMLGDKAADMDVAVLVEEVQEPDAYALASIAAHRGDQRELKAWRERFAKLDVQDMIYGAILVQKHRSDGQQNCTMRRQRSDDTTREASEWVFGWESAAAQPSRDELLLRSKPRGTECGELQVRHKMHGGQLVPTEYAFRTKFPFETTLRCGPWLAYVFSLCNGERTGAEIYAEARPRMPEGVDAKQFCAGLSALLTGGFVDIEGYRVPA